MKQRSKISRFLSLALCICMVLALLPAIPLAANAATISAGTKLYLKPNSNWTQSNARFAAYFFNSSTNQWVSMSDPDGNGIYECTAPSGSWTNVIFCRMNPANSTNNWTQDSNFWNKTQDLTYDGTKDLYTVKSGTWNTGGGTWTKATCDEVFHNMSGNQCTRCGDEGRIVYFQNNWEWQNVKVYYWKGNFNNGWPGYDVGYYGKANVDGTTRYYSVMSIPPDVDGFIINGTNNSNTGTNKQDQTATITLDDCYDGVTFCLDAYKTETDGHHVCQVKDFPICKDFAKAHNYVNDRCTRCEETYCQINGHKFGSGLGQNDNCERCGAESMTIFFKSTWGWSDVCLYEWYEGTDINNGWPGDKMSLHTSSQTGGSAIDYYYTKVPTDIDDVIVNGIKNNGTGDRDQSPSIPVSELYNGVCIEMSWDAVNKKNTYNLFDINEVYQCILGHTYGEAEYVWAEDNSSCTATRTCGRNGAHTESVTEESEATQILEANCANSLIMSYSVQFADCDWAVPQTTSREFGKDPSKHSFGSHYVINEDGTHMYVCNVCSVPVTEPEAHNRDTVVFAGNCQAPAMYQCSVCNAVHEGEINLDAHPAIAVKFDNGDGTHTEKWACCSTPTGEAEAHADENKDGYCDGCHVLMAPVQLMQTTVSLEGNICVNYFMLLSDEVANDKDAYIQFTMADGEEIQTSVRDSKLIDGYDVFTCEVNAKEMTDIITMQFFYGNGQPALAEDHPYNVRTYAQHVMKHYTDEKTKDLMTAMVNYGAASQLHFGYKAENLANYDKEGNLLVTVPDYENIHINEFPFTRGQGTQNVKLYSASLLLNAETTLRLFFNGRISATHNGKKLPVGQRAGLYYVDIVGIAAKELDDDVTITINDGTEEANIVFSPMAYCQIVEQEDSGAYAEEMKNLARALYLYNKAADEYFGEAVTEPQGTTLFNALNYLGGNGEQITTKVTSVTFGKANAYRDIASTSGVLVDVEQDAPAYAYYMPSESGWDVYVLSNDTIYLPKEAVKIFNGMSNMTTMNVDNLSTERTTTFKGLFQGCSKLQSLDVSKWDVSNVNDFIAAFNNCASLKLIGYEKWDTSKVTNMAMLFQGNQSHEMLDLRGWDMSSVTTMNGMFNGCTSMTSLNTTGWKLDKVTDFYGAFNECKALTQIKGIEGWGMGSATTLDHMFYNCNNLENLNISSWNVGNVTNFKYMLAHAKSITELDLSAWDVSNATLMNHMFYNCTSLQTLKAANWNTGKVTTFNHMFASADSNKANMMLQNIDVSNWSTGSVKQLYSMFYGCGELTALDLSNWDVSNVTNMSHMFADCRKLQSINFTGWDTSSLQVMDAMFNDCNGLVTLDVSDFDTQNVKEFCQVFESCESLVQIVGLNQWNTANGCTFEEMFAGCISLQELDLSSFDTRNARDNFKGASDVYNAFINKGANMLDGLSSLKKLILGANFDFNGNSDSNRPVVLPKPAPIDGQATKWYNAETDTYYDASEILQPNGKVVTYVAAVPPANP